MSRKNSWSDRTTHTVPRSAHMLLPPHPVYVVNAGVLMCVWTCRSQSLICPSLSLSCFVRQGTSLNLELTASASLRPWDVCPILLHPLPSVFWKDCSHSQAFLFLFHLSVVCSVAAIHDKTFTFPHSEFLCDILNLLNLSLPLLLLGAEFENHVLQVKAIRVNTHKNLTSFLRSTRQLQILQTTM